MNGYHKIMTDSDDLKLNNETDKFGMDILFFGDALPFPYKNPTGVSKIILYLISLSCIGKIKN